MFKQHRIFYTSYNFIMGINKSYCKNIQMKTIPKFAKIRIILVTGHNKKHIGLKLSDKKNINSNITNNYRSITVT